MDSFSRPYGVPSTQRTARMNVGPLSNEYPGAPPAYSQLERPSISRSVSGVDPSLSSSKAHSSRLSNYHSGNAGSGSSSNDSTRLKGNRNHSEDNRIREHQPRRSSRGRAAPDCAVTPSGEPLSEKAPSRDATQTQYPSLSNSHRRHYGHGYRGRSISDAAARSPHYPPTPSFSNETSMCGCLQNLPPKVRIWLSFGAWIATSVGFLVAIAFWKTEVFTALDNLSLWLVNEGYTGYAYMFALIVLTTIPPFPLYSTLMMLAGYTWGTWPGFVLSYTSSLFGAIAVYFISRQFFGSSLVNLLKHMPSFARTVQAVSRNPKLLFLVRFAPYPYNVMNVLLAASPSLRWRTYIGCTAASLLKVVIHTSIGNGIRSFKAYHGVGEGQGIDNETTASEQRSHDLAKWSTGVGVVLCFLLLLYLGHVARRAVDHELEDVDPCDMSGDSLLPTYRPLEELPPRSPFSSTRHCREPSTAEERMAFLSPIGNDSDEDDDVEMSESRLPHGTGIVDRAIPRR
ncbi:hypothetical protein FRC16_010527 [Serendipita sp. 398]|nr:hypothetical protein FRC16_010527 [Serendipita sp. 398]